MTAEHAVTQNLRRPRSVRQIVVGRQVTEGAGVRLRRIIGPPLEVDHLDPFLLLDEFRSIDPDDYIAGFPWHPHRGIETVTYMLAGSVRHEDSLGHAGVIGSGDVQWMTAGHGIIHSEMPEREPGGMLWGFQLWINLPARLKLCDPRYQDLPASRIPEVRRGDGVSIRVVAGAYNGALGPVTQIAADPLFLDLCLPADRSFVEPIPEGHNAFCYVYSGEGLFGGDGTDPGRPVGAARLAILTDGDHLRVQTAGSMLRFLLITGRPLDEPVARGGPFVMNTEAEVHQAFSDYRNGTFLKGARRS